MYIFFKIRPPLSLAPLFEFLWTPLFPVVVSTGLTWPSFFYAVRGDENRGGRGCCCPTTFFCKKKYVLLYLIFDIISPQNTLKLYFILCVLHCLGVNKYRLSIWLPKHKIILAGLLENVFEYVHMGVQRLSWRGTRHKGGGRIWNKNIIFNQIQPPPALYASVCTWGSNFYHIVMYASRLWNDIYRALQKIGSPPFYHAFFTHFVALVMYYIHFFNSTWNKSLMIFNRSGPFKRYNYVGEVFNRCQFKRKWKIGIIEQVERCVIYGSRYIWKVLCVCVLVYFFHKISCVWTFSWKGGVYIPKIFITDEKILVINVNENIWWLLLVKILLVTAPPY